MELTENELRTILESIQTHEKLLRGVDGRNGLQTTVSKLVDAERWRNEREERTTEANNELRTTVAKLVDAEHARTEREASIAKEHAADKREFRRAGYSLMVLVVINILLYFLKG